MSALESAGPSWRSRQLLSQPVDYASEAVSYRFSVNRSLRRLASWRPSHRDSDSASMTEAGRQMPLRPHERLHPDRCRTFCQPNGWTSEDQVDMDLGRLHSAQMMLNSRKISNNKWRIASGATSVPTVPTEVKTKTKSKGCSRNEAVIPGLPLVFTTFGDRQIPLPPPPPPAPLSESFQQIDKAKVANKDPPNQDLSAKLRNREVASSAATGAEDQSAVSDYYSLMPTPFGGVSIRRLNVENNTETKSVCHVGRNGLPVSSTEWKPIESSDNERTGLLRPNLSWKAELDDPSATVLSGAEPGSKEAAAAAAAAAAHLDAQRRSRRIVGFDHVNGYDAMSSAREAAILNRLRARSAAQRQTQQQQQPPLMKRELTASDYASLVPIAESLDNLRRSKTQSPDAAAAEVKTQATKTAPPTAPQLEKLNCRGSRPRQRPVKKSLLTKPMVAATFSPRRDNDADASLVVSTLAGGQPPAGRVATGRALSSSSTSAHTKRLNQGKPGTEAYLSIVSALPSPLDRRLWSTGAIGGRHPPSSQQLLPPPSTFLPLSPPATPPPPPPPVRSAPMPSTPRDATADDDLEATGALMSASLTSLTSTKNSERASTGAVVKIPRAD